MNTENITVSNSDIAAAQDICKSITDPNIRNRAVANVLAAKIAKKYFDPNDYKVDEESGLHNVPKALEEYDLADIYVNQAYIDVRIYFEPEELCVPKANFDEGLLPVAYMFIKMSSDLKEASVKGFIVPELIKKDREKDGYYHLKESDFESIYSVEHRLNVQDEGKAFPYKYIYEYLDGGDVKTELYKELITSRNGRVKFIKAMKASYMLPLLDVEDSQEELQLGEIGLVQEEPIENHEIELSDSNFDELFSPQEPEVENPEITEGVEDNEADEGLTESDLDFATEVTPSGADVIASVDKQEAQNENSEQIETLFTNDDNAQAVGYKTARKSSLLMLILLFVLLLAGVSYWYFMIYNPPVNENNLPVSSLPNSDIENQSMPVEEEQQPAPQEETESAMPVETVEKTEPKENTETANSVQIPAIEQNLDASVLVSNLKVEWSVPDGYMANTSVRRYLERVGKIIQLNLKSELLLLSKPPLSNKITVELQFNPATGKYRTLGIGVSSGESTIDKVILQTVDSVLAMNISANTSSFAKLQGNPVLVIKL